MRAMTVCLSGRARGGCLGYRQISQEARSGSGPCALHRDAAASPGSPPRALLVAARAEQVVLGSAATVQPTASWSLGETCSTDPTAPGTPAATSAALSPALGRMS